MMLFITTFLYAILIVIAFTLVFRMALKGLEKSFSPRTAKLWGAVILCLFVGGMLAMSLTVNQLWMRILVTSAICHLPVTVPMLLRLRS